MTKILGTLTDSAGTPLSGELEITLDAPLIDASTAPDTILLPRSRVLTINAGAIALNLPQSETSNLTYHFRFNTFAEEVEFYFQNGDSYSGPSHQHTDLQWYTGNSHTSDSLLLSRYVQKVPTQILDFHSVVPNQSSVEFASLLPTGISTDVLDTSIRRLAQLLTSNADYATALRGGPNFKGIYSVSAYYQLGDAVVHGGGAWIYTQATPTIGNVPSSNSTFWQPFIPSIQLDAQKIGTVATIADLRALVNPQGTIEVLGYYSPGDGGGGLFRWDGESLDASTPIQTWHTIESFQIASGGTNYTVGDRLRASTGTSVGRNARAIVTGVNNGAITSIAMYDDGIYTIIPDSWKTNNLLRNITVNNTAASGASINLITKQVAITGNDGVVVIPQSNPATGRWKRLYSESVNVLWFGARRAETGGTESDALINVCAFNNALSVSSNVHVPNGLYWCDFHVSGYDSSSNQTHGTIFLPEGSSLIGENKNRTILKIRSLEKITTKRFIVCESNTNVANLTIDGNKDNIHAIPEYAGQKWSCSLVGAFGGRDANGSNSIDTRKKNVVFENLIVQNNPSQSAPSATVRGTEGFAVRLGGCIYSRISNVIVNNCEGSGISVDGWWKPGDKRMSENVVVENIRASNCTWNGITFYGVNKCSCTRAELYENYFAGFNAEWANNGIFTNILSYNNQGSGIRLSGYAEGSAFYNCQLENNSQRDELNTPGNGSALTEILITKGDWDAIDSGLTGDSINPPSGIVQSAEFHNIQARPGTNRSHIRIDAISSTAKIHMGLSVPKYILVDCPDVQSWKITRGDYGDINYSHGLVFLNLQKQPINISMLPVSTWNKSNVHISAYGGAGSQSLTPQIISATAQNGNIKIEKLQTKKTYLLKYRYLNNESKTATEQKSWFIKVRRLYNTQSYDYLKLQLVKNIVDKNNWFEGEAILAIPNDGEGDYGIVLACDEIGVSAANPANLIVDYLTVEEVVTGATEGLGFSSVLGNFGINNSDPSEKLDIAGNLKIRGGSYSSGHAILGNYHLWIDSTGKLRIKNGVPTSDLDGNLVGS